MIIRTQLLWVLGLLFFLVAGLNQKATAGVTLEPSLAVSEEYTDNFYFQKKDREGEYSTFIKPSFQLSYKSRALTLSGVYMGSLEIHSRNPVENGYAQRVRLDVGLPGLSGRVKNLDVQIVESFSFYPETPAYSFEKDSPETAVGDNEGIQVVRTDTFRNRAGIILGMDWSLRTRSTLSYFNRITRYDNPDLNDSIRQNLGPDVEYLLTRRTRLSVSYRVGLVDYENEETQIIHRAGMGIRHQISSSLLVDGNLGLIFFENEKVKLYSDGKITKNLEKGELGLGFLSDSGQGGGETKTVTLKQRVTGWATYSATSKSIVFARGAYGRNTSLPGKELETVSYEGAAGISIRLFDWLSGEVTYSHFNQRALGTIGSEGTRNTVLAKLTAVGPSWRAFQ